MNRRLWVFLFSCVLLTILYNVIRQPQFYRNDFCDDRNILYALDYVHELHAQGFLNTYDYLAEKEIPLLKSITSDDSARVVENVKLLVNNGFVGSYVTPTGIFFEIANHRPGRFLIKDKSQFERYNGRVKDSYRDFNKQIFFPVVDTCKRWVVFWDNN